MKRGRSIIKKDHKRKQKQFEKAVESYDLDTILSGDDFGLVSAKNKDWSEDFLKGKKMNELIEGKTVSKPYKKSYAVYKAINAISTNAPQAPFIIYKNEKAVGPQDQVQKLFNRPNRRMSRFELWESIFVYLYLNGEAFIYTAPSKGQAMGTSQLPAELYVLSPPHMKHVVDEKTGDVTNWLFNGKVPFDDKEIIHLKLFNPYNSYRGLSPIEAVQIEMQTDKSASEFSKNFFDNGATPGGVVELDKEQEASIDQLKKLKKMWEQEHSGSDNSWKVAFLLGGMTYKSAGLSQKDMSFIETRGFTRDVIISTLGVPKFIAGFSDGEINRSVAETSKRVFWSETLKPQLIRIQEKLASEFFMEYAPQYTGEFDFTKVPELQKDQKEQAEIANTLIRLGTTRNQLAEQFPHLFESGMPDGDTQYMPMNIIPIESNPAVVENTYEPKSKEEKLTRDELHDKRFLKTQGAQEKVFFSKIKRYFFSQRKRLLENLLKDKQIKAEYTEIFARLQDIWEDEDKELQKLIIPVYRDVAEEGIRFAHATLGVDADIVVNPQTLRAAGNRIVGINDTTWDQLKKEIFDGTRQGEGINSIADRVRSVMNHATTTRALKIARTETSSMLNTTSAQTYQEQGVRKKRWLATVDEKTRPDHVAAHAEGTIPIDGFFSATGMKYPGDLENGTAKQIINCRCSLVPVVEG